MARGVLKMFLGKVIRSKQQIGNDTTRKRLVVDIDVDVGGSMENVPYYGGGIDLVTNYPHGIFIPPRIGQEIAILCARGDSENPVGCFPLPFPSWDVKEEDYNKYDEIMEDLDDISIFHHTGTRVHLRADGTVEIAKDISGTKYRMNIKLENTKKRKTIEDLETNNKIILDEDGIQVIGKNGSNIKAAARKDDETTIDNTTDAAFIAWISTVSTAINALAPGTIIPPFPSSLKGKITKASDEVKISGASS